MILTVDESLNKLNIPIARHHVVQRFIDRKNHTILPGTFLRK